MPSENNPINPEQIAKNLLRFLSSKEPNDMLLPAIASLKELDINTLAQIFLKQDEDGNNILMLACYNHLETIPTLFDLFLNLNAAEKISILLQVSKVGDNIFTLIAYFGAEKALLLIKSIENLPKNDLQAAMKTILMQVNIFGNNALIYACSHAPQIIPFLISHLATLTLEQQRIILKQTENASGKNALMFALNFSPEEKALLEAMSQHPDILMQIDSKGWNALMLACEFNIKAIPFLIQLVKKLSPEQQIANITQQGIKGWTALINMVYHEDNDHSHAHELLNIAIENNDLIALVKMLAQRSFISYKEMPGGSTALQVAVYRDKLSALNSMLAVMKHHLEPADNYKILALLDSNWRNVIMNAIPKIKMLSSLLDVLDEVVLEDDIKELLIQKDNNGNDALMLALKEPYSEALLRLTQFIITKFKKPATITAVLKDSAKEIYHKIIINIFKSRDKEEPNKVLKLIQQTPPTLLTGLFTPKFFSQMKQEIKYETNLVAAQKRAFLQIQTEIYLADMKIQIDKLSSTKKKEALKVYGTFKTQLNTLFKLSNESDLNQLTKEIHGSLNKSRVLLIDLHIGTIIFHILKTVVEFLFSYEFEDLRAVRALRKIVNEYAPLKESQSALINKHGALKDTSGTLNKQPSNEIEPGSTSDSSTKPSAPPEPNREI